LDLGQRAQDLRGEPVAEPIVLRIPAIDVDAEILGVGMTAKDVMDAPTGEPDAAVWRQAFWYRGSAVPGQASTALIAGHVNNQVDDPGVFARLDELGVGDTVTVHDTRDGSDVTFTVTSTHSYTLAEAAEPEVLREMYGAGPIDGSWPVASDDGLAHLVLVTCAGTYVDGTHDHRLVVHAVR
jgi:sortase (surface protein transpeptidase)